MMRTVLILFGAVIAITVLRSALSMLGKILNPPQPKDPNTVEMVKCPSCGSVFAPHQHVKKG